VGVVAAVFAPSLTVSERAEAASALLTPADFTYVGAFKLPSGSFGSPADTFDYSGGFVGGNVYNDPVAGKTLFIWGFKSAFQVSNEVSIAQIAIPATIKDPNAVGLSGLATGTTVQGFADPSRGLGSQALVGNGYGSSVVYNGKLIGTEATQFDSNCTQTKSAWVAPLKFSQSGATGPYAFTESLPARILGGGYMTLVPPEWQSALGGKVVSGNGPTSIISCGSPGPSLHVIDADTLATQPAATTKISSFPLVYYVDQTHQTLGAWNSNSPTQVVNGKPVPIITVTDPHGRGTFTIPYEDNSIRMQGILFADGTSSVVFFGHKGLGPYCYGIGSDCGDLDEPDSKGDHAYPYTEFAWFYNVNDMIAVRQGQKQPWDIVPYTGWAFKVFGDGSGGKPVGVAWDAATRLAYMVVPATNGVAPLVHVWRVAGGSGSIPTPPAAPTNLRIIR
jgi:hypothetical protein